MGDIPQQQQHPQPQPQLKKKRTATQLHDKTEVQEIEFNDIGQYCGKKQTPFASECGVLTRSMISIEYSDWKKVPKPEIDMLWVAIKKRWPNLDEKRQHEVLLVCNDAWRSFKKRLNRDFLKTGRNPLDTYSYLEPEKWEIFRESRTTEEFRVISEKAKVSANLQKNPARLGPGGYRAKEAQWELDMAAGLFPPKICEIKSKRPRQYCMARLVKNDLGFYTAPENVQPVITDIANVEKQLSQGDLVLGPGEDSLTEVVGPEHPGRTRAVGHRVGLRKGMQDFDKKKRKRHEKQSMDDLHAKIAEMMSKIEELNRKVAMQDSSNQGLGDVIGEKVGHNYSSGSMPELDALKVATECDLMIPFGMEEICAKGLVFPFGNGLIHNLPMQKNHLKVLVDKICSKKYGNMHIPVPTDEATNLQQAVGQNIQWPRNAIILTEGNIK